MVTRKFDETLMQKVEKVTISQIYNYMDETFVTIKNTEKHFEDMKKQLDIQASNVQNDNSDQIKLLEKEVSAKIDKEVEIATRNFKASIYD